MYGRLSASAGLIWSTPRMLTVCITAVGHGTPSTLPNLRCVSANSTAWLSCELGLPIIRELWIKWGDLIPEENV
jgi:hypothetical protein